MTPKQLVNFLTYSIPNKFPILIKGKPGIGKTDIVKQVTQQLGYELIVSHPVVSDPTDYKGLPFVIDGEAHFIPFNELNRLIETNKPTVYFIDDIGQSASSVQAALMQLILARKINEHTISDEVVFIAATNRKEDKAGVSGLLEPVKSRFTSIVELEVSVNDWSLWAIQNNMPMSLVSFLQWKPNMLDDFKATKDITNSPSPRTLANIGKMINTGIPSNLQYEAFTGAAGEAFAVEYLAYTKLEADLPKISDILRNPNSTFIPEENKPSTRYAITGSLAEVADTTNIGNIITYTDRMGEEMTAVCINMAVIKSPAITSTKEFTQWGIKNYKNLWASETV